MAYKEEPHPPLEKAVEHIENIIIGKRDIAILSLAAILAKGHVFAGRRAGSRKNDDGPRFGQADRS